MTDFIINQKTFFPVASRSLHIAGLNVLRTNEIKLKNNVLISVTRIL
jgi:hypothetical protein